MIKREFYQKGSEAIRVTVGNYSDDSKVRYLIKTQSGYRDVSSTLGEHRELFNPAYFVGNTLDDVTFFKPQYSAVDRIGSCGRDPLSNDYLQCEKLQNQIHADLMGYGRGW